MSLLQEKIEQTILAPYRIRTSERIRKQYRDLETALFGLYCNGHERADFNIGYLRTFQ